MPEACDPPNLNRTNPSSIRHFRQNLKKLVHPEQIIEWKPAKRMDNATVARAEVSADLCPSRLFSPDSLPDNSSSRLDVHFASAIIPTRSQLRV